MQDITTEQSRQTIASLQALLVDVSGRTTTQVALLSLYAHTGVGTRDIASADVTFGIVSPRTNLQNALHTALLPALAVDVGGIVVTSVAQAGPVPVCGNQRCEYGEPCGVGLGHECCLADCPVPVGQCPVGPTGLACNGRGICQSHFDGSSWCSCHAGMGYTGVACADCAPGFGRVTPEAPCRPQFPSTAFARVSSSSSSLWWSNKGYLIPVAAAAGAVIAVIGCCVAARVHHSRRRRQVQAELVKKIVERETHGGAATSVVPVRIASNDPQPVNLDADLSGGVVVVKTRAETHDDDDGSGSIDTSVAPAASVEGDADVDAKAGEVEADGEVVAAGSSVGKEDGVRQANYAHSTMRSSSDDSTSESTRPTVVVQTVFAGKSSSRAPAIRGTLYPGDADADDTLEHDTAPETVSSTRRACLYCAA